MTLFLVFFLQKSISICYVCLFNIFLILALKSKTEISVGIIKLVVLTFEITDILFYLKEIVKQFVKCFIL